MALMVASDSMVLKSLLITNRIQGEMKLDTYEVTWVNGHTEFVQADVIRRPNPIQVEFLRNFDGNYKLMLAVHILDLRTIRNVITESCANFTG